jgi:hypothetical protein
VLGAAWESSIRIGSMRIEPDRLEPVWEASTPPSSMAIEHVRVGAL